MIELIEKSAKILAESANGNPIVTTILIFFMYCGFNSLEVLVEKLLFGERFEHWLDVVFIGAFISYSAYVVYACALFNSGR